MGDTCGMRALAWYLVILGTLAGFMMLVTALFAQAAPAQAAGAALAVGFAVVPYCLARSFDAINKIMREKK